MTTEPSSQGLRERSVGLRGDWIASITNVAPTAATTLTMAALIGASGLASPLALLVAGAAMLCCAVAYHRLNSWQASASAPVEWVARGLSPIIGFAVGILVLMTALTSNIGNITLIGSTVLSLIAPGETNNKPLTWVVATVVCLLVVAIAVIGVKVTIRFEGWVILVEYMIIASLAAWGLVTELTSHAAGITASELVVVHHLPLPRRVDRADRGRGHRHVPARRLGLADLPGRRAAASARPRAERAHLDHVLHAVGRVPVHLPAGPGPVQRDLEQRQQRAAVPGRKLGPKGFVDLVALAVIASFATTIQSQIVDGSRILFGMGRDRTVPGAFRRVSRFRTPVAGLVVMGVIPIIALILYLASNSLQKTIVYIDSTGGLLFASVLRGDLAVQHLVLPQRAVPRR